MNPATITAIIIGTSSALILGMAALIKTMVVGKLDALQAAMDSMKSDVHHIDLRVTKLETEHRMNACIYRQGNDE